MPKKIEDMVVSDRRRSIRDIPVPESRRKETSSPLVKSQKKQETIDVAPAEDNAPPPHPRSPIKRHRRGGRKRLLVAGVLALAIITFGILSLLNGATLSYVPKSAALTFSNDTYSAEKAGNAGLFYSVVKLSRDKGLKAPAGVEQDVSRKASGTIIVYNDSATAQRLVENTRFESAAGKIYRIQKAITVPAQKVVGGKTQPGTVEAVVHADEPGESYNSAVTDFTVPGLKGTARFDVIYARSKTPLSGGFVGKERAVSAADLTRIEAELQSALREELWTEAVAEVPEDFILFKSLATFDFEKIPQTTSADGSVTVNQRGHIYGVMFKRSDLANFLGQKKVSLPPGDSVEIASYDGLTLAFATSSPADLLALDKVNFKVSGSAVLVWLTDEVALKADLVGKHKNEVPAVLNNYPTIASASVTVRPFWKSSLPNDPEKIKIQNIKAE